MQLTKNKIFCIFLLLNAILWTLLQFFSRNLLSIDAMEAISWGELLSFGTNKHPPLSGWIIGGFYHLFGYHDIIAYILGQICLLIGFIYIYKLGKFFLSEEKAMCASILMTSCYYFTYKLFLDNFNCNFLSIPLWAMCAYYFYKSLKENNLKDWILLGISAGLGAICKYQIIFLILALFLYLLICERKQFKNIKLYIAFIISCIIVAPHMIWLIKNDFISFAYMLNQTDASPESLEGILGIVKRVFYPFKFMIDQILILIPSFIVYAFLALQAKNISFKKDGNLSDKIFLICITIIPIFSLGCVGFFSGTLIHGVWGSVMVNFMGIALLYFFPVEFKKNTFNYFIKWAYFLLIVWLIIMGLYSQIHINKKMSYPYQKILSDFDNIWKNETNNAPLKYVSGHIDYIFQFKIYDKSHPDVILETFGKKNPWVNHNDIINSGAIVFGTSPEEVVKFVKETVILLPDNYRIKPVEYNYEAKNIFNKKKEYNFFYTIIPPADNKK